MGAYEATKVVFARLQAVDRDLAPNIVAALLGQDNSERDMIRLAFGPDHLLHSLVATARATDCHRRRLSSSPPSPPPPPQHAPWAGGDEYGGGGEAYPEECGCWSPVDGGGGGGVHRRSMSDVGGDGGGWKPCMYYARGFCKNGSACRFLHGLRDDAAAAEQEAAMRAKAARSQLMASAFPFSPSPKAGVDIDSLLLHHHHQQSEPQRAAMLLGGGGDDAQHRFPARRVDVGGGNHMANPAARQIYLTFPADSTFSEGDVSNYFSMFGPVQDVRIPYQQKRMFGFVTFLYPETVRLILSKGNPHFVCDSRVLVKPYKEKAKLPDKFRKFQLPPQHQGEFAGCTTPTGLLDSRDPFDLQQPQIGPRMMYGNMASREAFLRKVEEEQMAAELQQAIDLQGRRFMGLQLLDLHNGRGGHHLSTSHMGMAMGQDDINSNLNGNDNGNASHFDDLPLQDDNKLSNGHVMGDAASAAISAEGKHEQEQEEGVVVDDGTPKQAVNSEEEGEGDPGPDEAAQEPNVVCEFQESGVEHNLPDSPFASPTKISIAVASAATAHTGNISNSSPHVVASSLFPPSSTLDLPHYSSCFFQVPRLSPRHGAIGL